jgi:hypothetical protein
MRFLRFLRAFNTVALAVFSTLGLVILMMIATRLTEEWRSGAEQRSEVHGNVESEGTTSGQLIDAGTRKLTLYGAGDQNPQFRRNLQFVDASDGSITRLSDDPNQEFHNGAVVGVPRDDDFNRGYGYLTLAEVDEPLGKPAFEALFLRFSDMKRFKIAAGISALDGPQELDGRRFSFVVWNSSDAARFVLFDSETGKITVSQPLELVAERRSKRIDHDPPNAKYAP